MVSGPESQRPSIRPISCLLLVGSPRFPVDLIHSVPVRLEPGHDEGAYRHERDVACAEIVERSLHQGRPDASTLDLGLGVDEPVDAVADEVVDEPEDFVTVEELEPGPIRVVANQHGRILVATALLLNRLPSHPAGVAVERYAPAL